MDTDRVEQNLQQWRKQCEVIRQRIKQKIEMSLLLFEKKPATQEKWRKHLELRTERTAQRLQDIKNWLNKMPQKNRDDIRLAFEFWFDQEISPIVDAAWLAVGDSVFEQAGKKTPVPSMHHPWFTNNG